MSTGRLTPSDACGSDTVGEAVYTDSDVRRLWPQARRELLGFADHLARGNAGITAAQLRLAVQLADRAARALPCE